MKTIVAMSRTCLLLTVLTALSVGGAILAQHVQHTGKGQVKVTQLSQRDIIEKLDGKAARATVVEVTFEPGQKDSPHHHTGPVFGYVLRANTSTPSTTSRSRPTRPGIRSTSRRDLCTGWPGIRVARPGPASSR